MRKGIVCGNKVENFMVSPLEAPLSVCGVFEISTFLAGGRETFSILDINQ
jgi:hypothetical protein